MTAPSGPYNRLGLRRPPRWVEFLSQTSTLVCGLCGNSGAIDTRASALAPDGSPVGGVYFCICPNGRAIRRACKGVMPPTAIPKDPAPALRRRRPT